jgi:signal transduction histidine kinase
MTGPALRDKSSGLSLSLKFVIGCSLILSIALGLSFYALSQRQERLIMEQVEREARALFTQILITRSWIADHGGIFVERLPSMKPSAHLPEGEIVDLRGTRYLRKTPAMVTKELSRYSKDRGLYWFHITSLTLTNPENAPDDFEREALRGFEENRFRELLSIETIEGSSHLRYISPLPVEEACLRCHAHQAYKTGDIRGAISVVIPINKTMAEISSNNRTMLLAGGLTVLALMGAMFFMMHRLVLRPMSRLKTSMKDFSRDRHPDGDLLMTGDEFEDLSRSFLEMSRSLAGYHDTLNEQIRAATADIRETNLKLQEANRLLTEASAKKSDFLTRASHEIRTPLTSIRGAMDYISTRLSTMVPGADHAVLCNDLRGFFEVIRKNTERLIGMVNDMLDIERIEAGVTSLRRAPMDLCLLIREMLTYFQADSEDEAILFHTDLPERLFVTADEDRLRQVLINLLTNALKVSPHGGTISLKARAEGSVAVAQVCDEGPGIPPQEQEKVFEKFYRKGSKSGSGLGLAICRSIVEAHQGAIGVTSDGVHGSCFHFRLPLVEGPVPGKPSGPSAGQREEAETRSSPSPVL